MVNHKTAVMYIKVEDIVVNNIGVKGTGLRDKQAEGKLVSHNLVLASYK